jgi:hypothetical protein
MKKPDTEKNSMKRIITMRSIERLATERSNESQNKTKPTSTKVNKLITKANSIMKSQQSPGLGDTADTLKSNSKPLYSLSKENRSKRDK